MKNTKTEDTENKHTSGKLSDASTCYPFDKWLASIEGRKCRRVGKENPDEACQDARLEAAFNAGVLYGSCKDNSQRSHEKNQNQVTMNPENTNTQPDSEKISGRMQRDIEKLSPCYAIHRKRHLQSTYGEESKWVTTDKRIKIMGKIGIFAMVCEEQGMPYVAEISEIIPLG